MNTRRAFPARLPVHTSLQRVALLLASVIVPAVFLCACGGEEGIGQESVHWNTSKPGSRVGAVRAAIVERPSPDRARIEVQWEAGPHDGHEGECELRLLLPEGALLLEGESLRRLASDEPLGRHEWLVEFPLGRALDAVVTYCAETEAGPRAAEVTVRLTQE